MTDEQIEQNAEKYADVHGRHMADYYGVKDAFIAGAHSRDEEVKEWIESKGKLRRRLMLRIYDLRHPWISVEDRLPEKDGEYVLVYLPKYNEVFQAFLCDNEWIGAPIGEEVTHWMPIPQIEKGE